jgi:hypothetical protein
VPTSETSDDQAESRGSAFFVALAIDQTAAMLPGKKPPVAPVLRRSDASLGPLGKNGS